VPKARLFSAEERRAAAREIAVHAIASGVLHTGRGGSPWTSASDARASAHIVRLLDAGETPLCHWSLMEAHDGVDLAAHLRGRKEGKMPEAEALGVFREIMSALDALGRVRGVVHCDVKPGNILVQRSRLGPAWSPGREHEASAAVHGAVKLCDFGSAVRARDPMYHKSTGRVDRVPFSCHVGTAGYIAPEILERRSFWTAADVWSAGIVLYECLTAFEPFYPYSACTRERVQFHPMLWGGLSASCRRFVASLLRTDPNERPTAAQALAAPWLAERAWAKEESK
jgi:calcium/calmodulin-dependent protein kinase I